MHARTLALAALAALGSAAVVLAQQPSTRGAGAIAFYGTWDRGLRVAKESGKPILLVAAAPQCHGISGLW